MHQRVLRFGTTASMILLALALVGIPPSSAPHSPTRSGELARDGRALARGTTPRARAFTAAELRRIYDLLPLYQHGVDGRGTTVGLVDVYGVPTIKAELAAFDRQFNIPAPPSLSVVPIGRVPRFDVADPAMRAWAFETTLDVEAVHLVAPRAAIVLAVTGVNEVEGTSGFPEIVAAEKYLISRHVDVISQSFGATEETFASSAAVLGLRGALVAAARAGVTMVAATGDNGVSDPRSDVAKYYDRRVVIWPASDPLVTAVGGTQLPLGGPASTSLRAWGELGTDTPVGGGGGRSRIFARPPWQAKLKSVVGGRRGIPDISMDASCASGVVIYLRFPASSGGDGEGCGTSLAAPLFAGVVDLAAQMRGAPLGPINPHLYALGEQGAPGLVPVVQGSNSVDVPIGGGERLLHGYRAGAGYNLATGWGTVDAARLVPELAGEPAER